MAYRPAEQIIHKAAWLYYTHGLRQDEVAQRLNISRASVALYLRRAREAGIVNISASTELFRQAALARQVEDRFGLDAVWLAGEDGMGRDAEAEVPTLAANVFLELVGNGARVGLAWGRTVYAVADAMAHADLHRRHGRRTVRQSRRALFLPARPVHHGDRAPAQRQGAQFLRAAGAELGRAGRPSCATSR